MHDSHVHMKGTSVSEGFSANAAQAEFTVVEFIEIGRTEPTAFRHFRSVEEMIQQRKVCNLD